MTNKLIESKVFFLCVGYPLAPILATSDHSAVLFNTNMTSQKAEQAPKEVRCFDSFSSTQNVYARCYIGSRTWLSHDLGSLILARKLLDT